MFVPVAEYLHTFTRPLGSVPVVVDLKILISVTSETTSASAGRSEDPLDRGHDARVDVCGIRGWACRAAETSAAVHEGGAHAGPLSRGVPNGCRVVEREPEIHHPEQHQQDDRDDHRELDEALAALGSSPNASRITGPAPSERCSNAKT